MLNRVQLIGRLGIDPHSKTFGDKMVVNFTLATHENRKEKDGSWRQETEWHRIVMWSPNAERAAEKLRKGSVIYVEGKIQTKEWEDRAGFKKKAVEILASKFISLDARKPAEREPGEDDQDEKGQSETEETIPF